MKKITQRTKHTFKFITAGGLHMDFELPKGRPFASVASDINELVGGSKLIELDKLVAALQEEADAGRDFECPDYAEAIRSLADRLASGELEV